jgi:hypothetical protein
MTHRSNDSLFGGSVGVEGFVAGHVPRIDDGPQLRPEQSLAVARPAVPVVVRTLGWLGVDRSGQPRSS